MDEKLKKIIESLPRVSGVYLFYSGKDIIYIGKAINLRDRVKNHFQQPSYRDHLFIEKVNKITYVETGSEIEALVLEANLIKKHLPKFNVVWKDGKNYFYVAIAKNKEKLPYVFITHQKDGANTKYVGPFIEGTALKKTLKYLRRAFPFYTSARHSNSPCTWCHLGLCPGPKPDIAAYKKNIQKLILMLQGKRKTVFYSLRREMETLSKNNQFEEAATVRDRMQALERILQHTHVIENQKSGVGSWELAEKKLNEILYPNPSPIRANMRRVSRIECYDISNIQGKQAVGSMVVFVDGAPAKNQYKKFRIRMENEPNDIAMLKEVFTRRLAHPEWGYPEIMLIDGGIAQLNVAIKTKELHNERTKEIKVISIAKGKQELFIENQKDPIPLKDLPQEVYNLIKHLDDEAHRFALTYHRKVRKTNLLG